MNMKLKAPTRRSGGDRNEVKGVSNVPMQMGERRGDHAVCTLLSPAMGLAAGTQVVLFLRPEEKKTKRVEIEKMKPGQKNGMAPAFGNLVDIVAEGCYVDYSKKIDDMPVVTSRWINVARYDVENPGNSLLINGMISVEPVQTRKSGEEENYSQRRLFVSPDDSFSFNSFDDFLHKTTQWLDYSLQNGGGRDLEIIVRVTNNEQVRQHGLEEVDDSVPVISKRLRAYWHRERKEMMTAEESVNFFLDGPEKDANGNANPDYGMWRGYIEQAAEATNDGAYTFDAVVVRAVNTGLESLKKNVGANDDGSNAFRVPLGEEGKYTTRGFMDGSIFMRQKDDGRVFATDSFPLNVYSAIYADEDLKGDRADDVQAVFDQRAKQRGLDRHEAWTAKYKKNDEEPAPEAEKEQGSTFGGPGLRNS